MVGLKVTTPPAARPVSVSDVQRQLATLPEQGEHVEALIAAATERAEIYTGRALITQTLLLTLDAFPGQLYSQAPRRLVDWCWRIELPRPPLIGPPVIRYLDAAGVQQTLSEAAYRVSTAREPATIEPAYGESWPSTFPVSEAVEVEYPAGYGADGAAVPAVIRQAIVLMVGEWLEFREGLVIGTSAQEIPNCARRLLDGERLGRMFACGGIG